MNKYVTKKAGSVTEIITLSKYKRFYLRSCYRDLLDSGWKTSVPYILTEAYEVRGGVTVFPPRPSITPPPPKKKELIIPAKCRWNWGNYFCKTFSNLGQKLTEDLFQFFFRYLFLLLFSGTEFYWVWEKKKKTCAPPPPSRKKNKQNYIRSSKPAI